MGLNDLMNEIKQDPNSFIGDESVENKVLRQVLKLVEDKISEVKNQAVKWYVCTRVALHNHRLYMLSNIHVALANLSRSCARARWSSLSIRSYTFLWAKMRN